MDEYCDGCDCMDELEETLCGLSLCDSCIYYHDQCEECERLRQQAHKEHLLGGR
jgi:hypothetical protein